MIFYSHLFQFIFTGSVQIVSGKTNKKSWVSVKGTERCDF